MITVNFDGEKDTYKTAAGLWQWDYGQKLQLVGLSLPAAVEIHFSIQQSGGEAVTRIGVTEDGVTTVDIPDELLENGGKAVNYYIYAFVYVVTEESGETEYRISMPVRSRPKPKPISGDAPVEQGTMGALIEAVNEIASGKADGLIYKANTLMLMSGDTMLSRVVISSEGGGTNYGIATDDILGVVKGGENVRIRMDGTMYYDEPVRMTNTEIDAICV